MTPKDKRIPDMTEAISVDWFADNPLTGALAGRHDGFGLPTRLNGCLRSPRVLLAMPTWSRRRHAQRTRETPMTDTIIRALRNITLLDLVHLVPVIVFAVVACVV
jgi:hypothetical protein